jgi:hypothetical protein
MYQQPFYRRMNRSEKHVAVIKVPKTAEPRRNPVERSETAGSASHEAERELLERPSSLLRLGLLEGARSHSVGHFTSNGDFA